MAFAIAIVTPTAITPTTTSAMPKIRKRAPAEGEASEPPDVKTRTSVKMKKSP